MDIQHNLARTRHYNALRRRRSRQTNPVDCAYCYDVATGTLRCTPSEGEAQDLDVDLVGIAPGADGSLQAVLVSESFGNTELHAFPICNDFAPECCYDATTETLTCPDSDLDGTPAGIVAAWSDENGQLFVWAAWEGGGARIPLCPGTTECPPVFCAINVQTLAFVCPGLPDLDGQRAPVADIVIEDDYAWAVLEDGERVPLCGRAIPAPTLVDGVWRSRAEKACCSSCAHGGPCEGESEPEENPCCDSCAHGGPCEGESNPRPRRIFGRAR